MAIHSLVKIASSCTSCLMMVFQVFSFACQLHIKLGVHLCLSVVCGSIYKIFLYAHFYSSFGVGHGTAAFALLKLVISFFRLEIF